jgi:hypothetical protein
MDTDFKALRVAMDTHLVRLFDYPLFRVNMDGSEVIEIFLKSFPAGSNPLFRTRTVHECSCCLRFIKVLGNVVAVINGKKVSIWRFVVDDPIYQVVVDALANVAESREVANQFLHNEKQVGIDKNYEEINGHVHTWDHFFVKIPYARNSGNNFYCDSKDIGLKLSDSKATHDVFLRSLKEITRDSLETVIELVGQNSLYRGEEHKFVVSEFLKSKKKFDKLTESERDLFVWENCNNVAGSVSRILNTSIGSLLSDLSEGKDLEDAVKSFEYKVAPANYKRTTSLVTKKQVETARATIEELGLTSALQRRYAHLSDITVNNILFVNRETRQIIEGDVFDSIPTKSSASIKQLDKVEEVSIGKFLLDILPKAESLEVFFENRYVPNLMSLIAPVDDNSGRLLKWNNKFSWTYNGDVTDSIKERVKRAGGNVVGDLCCRLAWHNYDDLDFHMHEPGYEISFMNKAVLSPSGGRLDVDMNAGSGTTREPVENIYYESRSRMKEGSYHLFVHQFAMRETSNIGFDIEVDYLGDVTHYSYDKAIKTNDRVTVVKFKYSREKGIEVLESLKPSYASKEVWNLKTQDFHKVNVLMMSPNYWDEQGTGNKHYFFMLDGCRNDGSARGFYNEFLREELTPHRKVFEMVGSKMNTGESNEQLSGLGFSSTKRSDLLVRVKGSFTRTVRVIF